METEKERTMLNNLLGGLPSMSSLSGLLSKLMALISRFKH
jgi:hypothetical protein